jgi:hypothetical protein
MADKYVALPLFSDAEYEYTVALQGDSYTLRFIYNERMKLYTISLLSADLVPIVMGEALVPSYPMFFEYALYPLTGYFYMYEKANLISEAYKVYPENINEYYELVYVYQEDE